MKDTIFVLSLLGILLTASGALGNWWSAKFASNYEASYLLASKGFAVATIGLAALAAWAKLSKPNDTPKS